MEWDYFSQGLFLTPKPGVGIISGAVGTTAGFVGLF